MGMYSFEARNHPAQKRFFNRRTNRSEPLYDDHGNPVPLIRDQKALYWLQRSKDGSVTPMHLGYFGVEPDRPLSFIVRLDDPDLAREAEEFVVANYGTRSGVFHPPSDAAVERAIQQLRKQQLDDDEFDDDEELEDTDTDLDEGR